MVFSVDDIYAGVWAIQSIFRGKMDEKICVESDNGYVRGNQDRFQVYRLPDVDWQNFSIFSLLFKGIFQLVAKQSIWLEHISELAPHRRDLLLIEIIVQWIWDESFFFIRNLAFIGSGFAHLLPGVSGLVVRSLSILRMDQESVYAFKFII